jgi:hypothetical protein
MFRKNCISLPFKGLGHEIFLFEGHKIITLYSLGRYMQKCFLFNFLDCLGKEKEKNAKHYSNLDCFESCIRISVLAFLFCRRSICVVYMLYPSWLSEGGFQEGSSKLEF